MKSLRVGIFVFILIVVFVIGMLLGPAFNSQFGQAQATSQYQTPSAEHVEITPQFVAPEYLPTGMLDSYTIEELCLDSYQPLVIEGESVTKNSTETGCVVETNQFTIYVLRVGSELPTSSVDQLN